MEEYKPKIVSQFLAGYLYNKVVDDLMWFFDSQFLAGYLALERYIEKRKGASSQFLAGYLIPHLRLRSFFSYGSLNSLLDTCHWGPLGRNPRH